MCQSIIWVELYPLISKIFVQCLPSLICFTPFSRRSTLILGFRGFFQFYPAPMHFNSKNVNAVMESKYAQEYQKLNEEYIEYEKIKQQYLKELES